MRYYQKTEAGFSLVETLVAVSILLIVIVGPMTLSMRAAKSSTYASEQVQAFFFAQEGIEISERARDTYLQRGLLATGVTGRLGNPWFQFTSTAGVYANCYKSTGCGMHWHGGTPFDCGAVSCLLYRTGSGRGRFYHNAAPLPTTITTPFTRVIYWTLDAAGNGIEVRTVVTWRTGSLVAEQKVELNTYLYNIYASP